jgi:hypothetical protein
VISTGRGTWLRDQREARSWNKREAARRLIQAGRDAGDTHMPSPDDLVRSISRWERGSGITERYILYYCKILTIAPAQFGHDTPSGPPAPAAVPGAPLPASTPVTYRGNTGDSTVEREILMTAHDSGEHAEQAGQPAIGDTTSEQLRADVTRLIRAHDTGEPFAAFLEMRRVRDRIYRLLDQRMWPREQTSLYFLLGCLNGAMGGTANYLGYPDAAEELIRAGWAYAHAIDHRPLRGLLRLELSIVMYESGRFEESRSLAVSGLTYLPAGTQGADLHLKHAQAAARLGDADAARRAVHEAHTAYDLDHTDELLEMGGKFLISRATHHGLAGAALTATEGAEGEAAAELERAIGFYDEGPQGREQHWFAGKPLASIDLAMVRLRSGALDGAAAALEPALSLPAGQRITRVTTRLAVVRDELAAPIFHGSAQARDLGAQIEEFGREAVVAGLHTVAGGPR